MVDGTVLLLPVPGLPVVEPVLYHDEEGELVGGYSGSVTVTVTTTVVVTGGRPLREALEKVGEKVNEVPVTPSAVVEEGPTEVPRLLVDHRGG